MNDHTKSSRGASASTPAPRAGRTISATWWGHRWIAALEHTSRDVVARLGRGRAYARDGHVQDLHIKAGVVSAMVSDSDIERYPVKLRLDVFDDNTWQQVIASMHQQAIYVAQLLNSEMPKEINALFRACGKSLFPANSHDIDSDCGCEDWANPCKHVAATHYVLGEALDNDPFLLFELRGRTKEQVLGSLNRLRTASSLEVAPVHASESGVKISELQGQPFEQGKSVVPALHFDFSSPVVPGALLNSLGRPSSWQVAESPTDLLLPVLESARDAALEIASSLTVPRGRATSLGTASAEKRKRVRASKPKKPAQ